MHRVMPNPYEHESSSSESATLCTHARCDDEKDGENASSSAVRENGYDERNVRM